MSSASESRINNPGSESAPSAATIEAPLRRRVTIGFIVAVVLTIFMGVWSWRAARRADEEAFWVSHTHEVMDTVQHTTSHVIEAETSARTFGLTGQERLLGNYQGTKDSIQHDEETLRHLTADNPIQQQRLDALHPEVRNAVELADSIIARRLKQPVRAAAGDVNDAIETEKLMDEVRGTTEDLYAEEARLLVQRAQRARDGQQLTRMIAIIGGILGIGLWVLALLAVNREISISSRAQGQLADLNAELENRVELRTTQLKAANKELEAFTYSVSHDLRAPLRHISGFSKILMEEFGSTLPEDAKHNLQRIEEGTRRMGVLVDDLLNLARVGRRDLSLQVAGLRSVVEEVIDSLKPDVADRRLEWKIGDLPYVECDASLMKQVLQNLLSNAVKFTRPRAQAVIEVGQEERDGKPVVYVRDNGVGFSMKYSDKLFGVFQRLHRAEDFEGTGVGLATVQRIIQKHGGRIWADAELDKGATFYFTLGNSEKTELKSNAAAVGAKV